MALTSATVRVLDATGKAVATGKTVAPATGAYGPITLSGGGPYRVEACGVLGGRQRCLWAATTSGGTLNLSPLTSAVTVLAAGQPPEALMSGAVQGLGDAAIASAQTQLRSAIAPALSDAGLAADFDLMTGTLTPGSHAGYDRLLDGLQIGFGQDGAKAFVQILPRVGTGLAYLEPGSTTGSIGFDPAASGFDWSGLDALYASMSVATVSTSTCQSGLTAVLDPTARINYQDLVRTGADAAQLLCFRLSGVLGGENLFGGKLLRPELARCDFSGAEPVCRLGPMTWQTTLGDIRILGVEQAAVRHASGWQYLGNRLDVQASATTRTVQTRRTDASAPDAYARYLDIDIAAAAGLQCARVSQKDKTGAAVILGYFKPASGASSLSLWATSASNGAPSLDPASGATQGPNQIALPLASGSAGDAIVRNFVQAGPALQIDLYTDAACSAAWTGADGARLGVDLIGLPPLSSTAQSGQPWPSLAPATSTALAALKGGATAKISLAASWTFGRGGDSLNTARLCTEPTCFNPIAGAGLAASAVSTNLSATLAVALNAGDFKQLRLLGRAADGATLQADFQSCTSVPAGSSCK